MDWLAFCINFMGLMGCYSNHMNIDAKSLKANILEANYLCKVTCTTERKHNDVQSSSNELKDLGLSCCGHSALMQFRPMYYLVSNQVCTGIQKASKVVLNFLPKMSICYSATTHS